jgi:hypothetical protein
LVGMMLPPFAFFLPPFLAFFFATMSIAPFELEIGTKVLSRICEENGVSLFKTCSCVKLFLRCEGGCGKFFPFEQVRLISVRIED